jgi:mannose-6-phosphate isomerase-like protein (cupin superfamily)
MSGGPVWGAASEDLNATKLVWPAGAGPAEHAADRDVVYVVLEGAATVTVDGVQNELAAGDGLIVDKGSKRSLTAGPAGVAYFTAHLRRGGLEIGGLPAV